MSRKVKSVSFNLNDPFELELLNYTEQYPNFSNHVKRLIQDSMNGKVVNLQITKQVVNEPMEQPIFDKSLMKQFL